MPNQLPKETNDYGYQYDTCYWCKMSKFVMKLQDPYDFGSGSPIVSIVKICRSCYIDRALGVWDFAKGQCSA